MGCSISHNQVAQSTTASNNQKKSLADSISSDRKDLSTSSLFSFGIFPVLTEGVEANKIRSNPVEPPSACIGSTNNVLTADATINSRNNKPSSPKVEPQFGPVSGHESNTSSAPTTIVLEDFDVEHGPVDEGLEGEGIYKRIRPIGRGVSSTVYLAINCKSLQYVAIKDLESDAFVSEEIGALFLCRVHPCLVHVKDVYLRTPTTWSIVTEYVDGTSWGRSFSPECMSAGPREPYSVGMFLRILRDVLRGLQFLHNVAKVAHMDIKPENVMVLSKPTSATDVHAKIIDLGLCRPATTLTTSSAGTLYYSSPEKMLGNKTNRPYCPKAADIWALGISCVVALFRTPQIPYDLEKVSSQSDFIRMCLECESISFPHLYCGRQLPPLVVDILQTMVHRIPSERGTADTLLRHAVFGE